VGRVHVAVVEGWLLLVVQILVERALVVAAIHLGHLLAHLVHVRVYLAHVVMVSTVIVLMCGSVVLSVVKISRQITVIFLVVSGIAEPIGVRFDEPESNAENDVEAG